eukprot:CCRYP_011781-RA/>CCRYP_011781-RA protein AED:0.59 eAED:0.44 QI:0/0/0/1/0/0/2/0/171
MFLNYDNESGSVRPSLDEVDDSSTDNSFFSAGDTHSFPNHECFELELEEPMYILGYSEGKMEWFDNSLPLWLPGGLDSKDFDGMEDMFFIQAEDELFGKDYCYATKILDAKYEWTNVAEVLDKQTHLNAHQIKDLLQVLQDISKMFNGTLGLSPHHKVHIELVPYAKSAHA